MFSEMFFSSKNCSSVISCWVNKETLSVKQPYCMNCHKWNCSELTRTIDHTFICLFWSFFFLPLGTCFNVVQHLLCTDLEVCNPLKYICKEECQGPWKSSTTTTEPTLKWETASYSPDFNRWLPPSQSKIYFDSVSCHVGTSAVSHPRLV